MDFFANNKKSLKINKTIQSLNPFTKLASGVQKVAEKASDVRDLVDTSRDDAVDFNKRLNKVLPMVKQMYTKLKKPLDDGRERYTKSLEFSIYMFARYITYKESSREISDQYEEIMTYMRDFPVACEGDKLSAYSVEILDCFEKGEHRRELERRKKQDPEQWKKEQELANSAQALTESCQEMADAEEKYANMSTCDIIRSNKELMAEVCLYGERCSDLWQISGQLSRDFVASKELAPPSRYSRLREMLRKAVNNRVYLEMCT